MSACEIPSDPQLHPALSARFSPVRYRRDDTLTTAHVDTLLDAARRAPSAGNSQPWSFIVGRRGDEVHARLARHLARSSRAWAPDAALLVANLTQMTVEDAPDWEYSEFAAYDLGQAVAHMCVQGLAMGLDSHQFRAFDREGVEREFSVLPHLVVMSMTAFGAADHGPGEIASPGTSRERRGLEEIVWARA